MLGFMEVRGHFSIVDSVYVRTYHNLTSDFISRESAGVVHDAMQQRGFERLDGTAAHGARQAGAAVSAAAGTETEELLLARTLS